MSALLTFAIAFAAAAVASLALTRVVRDAAIKRAWLDTPNARKWHARPTPRLGGVAVYLALVAAVAVVARVPLPIAGAADVATMLGLAGLMMLLGLLDDLRPLPARTKFVSQVGIAVLAWILGFRIIGWWSYAGAGWELGVLSLPITVVWIVGITNALNLIDGLDGLGAGTALFAALALLMAAFIAGQPENVLLLAALAGAAAGFLRYNFNRATIFLGDSGSLMLGCLLALLSIQASQKSTAAVAVTVPLLALGLPVMDTTLVVIRRLIGGQPIFSADRRHLHHALLERGLTPRAAVIVLYGVAGVLGLTSLLFLNPRGQSIGLALTALAACMVVAVQQLRFPEFRDLNAHLRRTVRHRRALVRAGSAMHDAIERFRAASSTAELCAALATALEETSFSRVTLHVASPPDATGHVAAMRLKWQWTRRGAERTPREWRLEMPVRGGRLTAFHVPDGTYPAAIVSWLGEDVTAEFDRALSRIERTVYRHPIAVARLSRAAVPAARPAAV